MLEFTFAAVLSKISARPLHIFVALALISTLLLLSAQALFAADKDFSYFPCPFKEDKDDGRWGYIDKTGRVVIKPQFYGAYLFREGLARVISKNGKTGFIDTTGKMVIPPIFDDIDDFQEGMARIHFYNPPGLNHKIGYINKKGVIVIKPIFERAQDFSEGLALACGNKKCGYINKNGKYVIASSLSSGWPFSEGLAVVCIRGKCGYIDKTGKFAVKPVFKRAWSFSEGLAAVSYDGEKWGFIDKSGKIIIKPRIDHSCGKMNLQFSDGFLCVQIEDKEGFIDRQGKLVIDTSDYARVWDFQEGLAGVVTHEQGKDIAYIDGRGEPVYKDVIMYIDKTGQPVFKVQAEVVGGWLGPFTREGVAEVCNGVGSSVYKGCGFIDKQGRFTIEQELKSN
jgi:hypothetical protein